MPGILFHHKYSQNSNALSLLILLANTVDVLAHAKTFREAIDLLIQQRKIPRNRRQQSYDSLSYLKRRGYIRLQPFLKPTITGREFLSAHEFLNLELPRPQHWDGKWRMEIFDIPNEKNSMRLAFKDKIKSLGFRMIQRSVWIYPYECGREIDQLRTIYRIRNYVTYAVVHEIEDDAGLRKLFTL